LFGEIIEGLSQEISWWHGLIAIGIPTIIGASLLLQQFMGMADQRIEQCREMAAQLSSAERATNGITCFDTAPTRR
jgi:hypothetical protein